ncbi:TolC family protein [Helicobacter marmotae]|uniref:TolC family protein n=1 Tax=Helicobacter marmotae TaxID=152490 RepID=A0A3D8I2D8_9HELI|nr:TolC family protein [Helicobacter marmotae]RDU59278.1 TolC family protein [Helicobacter marmotae]
MRYWRYICALMLCINAIYGDSEFIDFNKLEEEFHIHTPNNQQHMSIDEFIQRVELNSIDLAKTRAMGKSLLYEGRAMRASNSPYLDAELSQVKSPQGGNELESTILFMLAPRLPWVSYTLKRSYQNKILRQDKIYELSKRLAIISAKRLYLDYLVLDEQNHIYATRYENAKNQLKISQAQYEAGRISKSQYLFFKSDFLATKVAFKTSYTELANTLNALKVILGIDTEGSVEIEGLDFSYLHFDNAKLESLLDESLYLDIIALDIKDYQYSAQIASQSRFDNVEIGGGIVKAESSDGIMFKLKVPLPLTTKYGNQKALYLALQSGSIREGEILKDSLSMNAKSYLEQLSMQKQTIALAKDNENNRAELSEISRIGYEAGKTSAFEYLSVKNDHLDAMIATTQAKRDYILTLSKLEETLSSILNLPTTPSTKAKS